MNMGKHLQHCQFCLERYLYAHTGIGSMDTQTAASSKGQSSKDVREGPKRGKAAARALGAPPYAEDTSDDDEEQQDNATVSHYAFTSLFDKQ